MSAPNDRLIRNTEGFWECFECGSDNIGKCTVCEFCETPRGGGLVASSHSKLKQHGPEPNKDDLAEKQTQTKQMQAWQAHIQQREAHRKAEQAAREAQEREGRAKQEQLDREAQRRAEAEKRAEAQRRAEAEKQADAEKQERLKKQREQARIEQIRKTQQTQSQLLAVAEDCPASSWAKQRRDQLVKEIREIDTLKNAEQRVRLRALQLELHPDKQQPDRREHAQLLFLLVQAKWEQCDRFAAEAKRKEEELLAKEQQQTQAAADRRRRRQEEAAFRQQNFSREAARRKQMGQPQASPGQMPGEQRSEANTQENGRQSEPASADQQRPDVGEPTSSVPQPVTLHISDVSGHICSIEADRCWHISELKVKLEAKAAVDPERQRLLCDGKDLDNGMPMTKLPAGNSVQLLLVACLDRYFQRDLFLKELQDSWRALQYAAPKLRADRALVKLAMEQDPRALQYAATELRSDPELVAAVLERDGLALENMGAEIRGDAFLVSIAVRQNWRALRFCAPYLRKDPNVIRICLLQDVAALEFAAEDLLRDRKFALSAVWLQGGALKYLHSSLRQDREVVLQAARKEPSAVTFAAPQLFGDPSFVSALKGNSEVPKFLDWEDEQRHQVEEDLFDRFNVVLPT